MANITLLHWNLETYGPDKFSNANNPQFIDYISKLILRANAEIVSLVEVKNSVAAFVAVAITNTLYAMEEIDGANPWSYIFADSGRNKEAYIILYRKDRGFLPAGIGRGSAVVAGTDQVPSFGLSNKDAGGKAIGFPSRKTPNGGRPPFYATFQTKDNNRNFSVISYHAMFGTNSRYGIERLPKLNYITQFNNPPRNTKLSASLISGDFNVEFNAAEPGSYTKMITMPSYQATDQLTSLKDAPAFPWDDPQEYRHKAYDNIFQTVAGAVPTGHVIDLMVESAVVPDPQPPPPAAQPHLGGLSEEAGVFNPAHIPNRFAQYPSALPPNDMPSSWAFVREAISNHYPVVTTVQI